MQVFPQSLGRCDERLSLSPQLTFTEAMRNKARLSITGSVGENGRVLSPDCPKAVHAGPPLRQSSGLALVSSELPWKPNTSQVPYFNNNQFKRKKKGERESRNHQKWTTKKVGFNHATRHLRWTSERDDFWLVNLKNLGGFCVWPKFESRRGGHWPTEDTTEENIIKYDRSWRP